MRRLFGSFEGAIGLSLLMHAIAALALRPSVGMLGLHANGPLPFRSGVQVSLVAGRNKGGSPVPSKKAFPHPSTASLNVHVPTNSASGASGSEGPQGVLTEAQSSGSIMPIYPRKAKLNGEEGRIEVEVSIDAQGKVEGARVLNETEARTIPLLAQSTLDAVRSARFSPAIGPDGAVASVKKLFFVFKLRN